MSILIIPVRYAPHVGGIETLLDHTLPPMRDRGFDFVIAAGVPDDTVAFEEMDGVPVYRLPFYSALRSYDPGAILDIGQRLRAIELDHDVTLRHVHGLDFNMFFVARQHRRAPLPLMISVHGTLDMPFPFSPITLGMLAAADRVTAVSNGVRDSVESTVPELTGRVSVIPNAIAAPEHKTAWPASGNLFCAGRFDSQKGFDLAIDALGRLATRYPHLRLRIAGTGSEWDSLHDHAARAGLADRVDFLGLLDDDAMLAEIAAASVVLVPSRIIEGFALVALEAAHLGRPVVATDVGGLSETVIDGVTGLLVPPEDADALATAVDRLLAAPDRAATMGTAARLAAARFDVDECAGAYTDAYRELGAERVTRPQAMASGASNG